MMNLIKRFQNLQNNFLLTFILFLNFNFLQDFLSSLSNLRSTSFDIFWLVEVVRVLHSVDIYLLTAKLFSMLRDLIVAFQIFINNIMTKDQSQKSFALIVNVEENQLMGRFAGTCTSVSYRFVVLAK